MRVDREGLWIGDDHVPFIWWSEFLAVMGISMPLSMLILFLGWLITR